jgi:hypothetical protein
LLVSLWTHTAVQAGLCQNPESNVVVGDPIAELEVHTHSLFHPELVVAVDDVQLDSVLEVEGVVVVGVQLHCEVDSVFDGEVGDSEFTV